MAVRRAMKYAALRSKPNRDKQIALVFYNYPPGKANIGASYLNVAESLANILQRLAKEGYNVGRPPKCRTPRCARRTSPRRPATSAATRRASSKRCSSTGRRGSRQPRPSTTRWLNDFTPGFRAKLLKDWGPPEKQRLMVINCSDGAQRS